MTRSESKLKHALERIPELRDEFWQNASVSGSESNLNLSLERAGRVADFIELGELMCLDALARDESCGCHFREEFQTSEGEAKRNDEEYCHVAAWEFGGDGQAPQRFEEALHFESVQLAERSYK